MRTARHRTVMVVAFTALKSLSYYLLTASREFFNQFYSPNQRLAQPREPGGVQGELDEGGRHVDPPAAPEVSACTFFAFELLPLRCNDC